MRLDGGGEAGFQRFGIGHRAEAENKAVEFVMIMFAVEFIMVGGACRQIIFGSGGQAQQDIGVDARLFGFDYFHPGAQVTGQQRTRPGTFVRVE